MIILTIELLCLLSFFRFVLNFEFVKDRIFITVACMLIILNFTIRFFAREAMNDVLSNFLNILLIVTPVFIFEGKKALIILLAICISLWENLNEKLALGNLLRFNEGHIEQLDLNKVSIGSNCFVLICLLICGFILRRKGINLCNAVDKIKTMWFVIISVFMYYSSLSTYYTESPDADYALMIQGMNMGRNSLVGMLSVIMIILIFVVAFQNKALKYMVLMNERCIKEQTLQYRRLEKRNNNLRKFYHDYNKHITTMKSLAKEGESEELYKYIDQMLDMKKEFVIYKTNNLICDAILNQYKYLCDEKNIDLKISGVFSKQLAVKETDLCIILSNAMENALEATQKCKLNKEITVDILSQANYAFINIRNSTDDGSFVSGDEIVTTKADKVSHGLGIINMKEAVGRCNGEVNYRLENNDIVLTEIILQYKYE